MPNEAIARSVQEQHASNTKGAFWALLATALFASAAAMAKIAVEEFHVLQILFFRQIVVFLSSLPSLAVSFPDSLKTRYPLIHACRLLGAFVGLSFGIWAVALLPLTTAITLGFAQVFFIALLALYFLDESVGIHRIDAIVVGFVGVIVVMRPGVDGILDIHSVVPIIAAIGAAVATISVRKLSQTDSTATLLVYQALFVGLLASIPLLWLWKTPDIAGLSLLLAIGTLATIGQWVGVKALRLGEASVIGNIQYMQLIFAAFLGFFLFDEFPDRYTMLGAGIIVSSAIYLLRRERMTGKR